MNPVAESLTGWESREAQSQRIGDILTVVDEATQKPIESPSCAAFGRASRSAWLNTPC